MTPSQRRVAPVRWASICHGTRLAWCSISVTTMESPGPTTNRAASGPDVAAFDSEYATRLIPSVAFLVNTTSSGSAPMNAATVARARSYASVASSESWCAPRWTAALCCS